jgi:GT2 family glycosyltransferase
MGLERNVAVIIPTCDRDDLLRSCLASLDCQTLRPSKVVVVDNGNRSSMPPFLGNFSSITWKPLFGNKGTAVAFNQGLAATKESRFVLLLNNDAELEKDCLAHLVEVLESKPECGIAVPKLLQWSNPDYLDGAGDEFLLGGGAFRVGKGELDQGQHDHVEFVLSACGAAALFRRSLFEEIGAFDEDFFAYREDVDLSLRAQLRRHRCVFVPQARARHRGSATFGSASHPEIIRLSTRNQIWLLIKNYPAPVLFRLAPRLAVFQILWLGLAIRKKALRSCLSGYLGVFPLLREMLAKRRACLTRRLLDDDEILDLLRQSEKRILLCHASVYNTRPSRLLTAYFRVFGGAVC